MSLGYSRPDDLPDTLSTIMPDIIDDKPVDVSRSILHHSHIIDDDRRINAQRFEEQFYQSKATLAAQEAQEETKAETASQIDQEMLLKLLANPEMMALLKILAKNL